MERQCTLLHMPKSLETANYGIIVFRAAHDSSKAMRIWMGEMKKKS